MKESRANGRARPAGAWNAAGPTTGDADGTTATGRVLWGHPGTSLGWIWPPSGGTPAPALRVHLHGPGDDRAFVASGGLAPLAQAALLLERTALGTAGRAFLHDVNGKVMGLSSIFPLDGPPQPVELTSEAAVPFVHLATDLRVGANVLAAIFRIGQGAPTEVGPSELAPRLAHLLRVTVTGNRPVPVQTSGSPVTLLAWVVFRLVVHLCAVARAADSLPGGAEGLRVSFAVDAGERGGQVSWRVTAPALATLLATAAPPQPLPDPVVDWLLATVADRVRLTVDGTDLVAVAPAPGPGPDRLEILGPLDAVPEADPGDTVTAVADGTDDYEVYGALARHAATLRQTAVSPGLPATSAERLPRACLGLGLSWVRLP